MPKFTYGQNEIESEDDTNITALESAGWQRVPDTKKSDK